MIDNGRHHRMEAQETDWGRCIQKEELGDSLGQDSNINSRQRISSSGRGLSLEPEVVHTSSSVRPATLIQL